MLKSCQRCELYKNQQPLLDNYHSCDVMWVGLSAKKVNDLKAEIPLNSNTNSGALIKQVEDEFCNLEFYHTNLVKCLPLNNELKLRYPSEVEISKCIHNLITEIEELSPEIVFVLGNKVAGALGKYLKVKLEKGKNYHYLITNHNHIKYVLIEHPSYIHIYRSKDKNLYITGISKIIKGEFNEKKKGCF